MKVEVLNSEYDFRDFLTIRVNEKRAASFHDGEPEDGTLGRDFNDCYNIGELMKQAYEAGKNGEEFELVSKELEWEEYEEL